MSKQIKKVNPYEKKKKRSLKITREQRIGIIVIACVVILLAGIAVGKKIFKVDEHAGHNHDTETGEHYEGDGHDHSNSATTSKVNYQIQTNEDQTYRLVFSDNAGKTVAKFDQIPTNQISKEAIDADAGVYAVGWATASGPNDFECVYYNIKTGQVSQKFHAPRGSDGVRIAYGSEDQTKVIVQDLFNKDTYYKEYSLLNPYTGFDDTIIGGSLQKDKTVSISYYIDDQKNTRRTTYQLYE